GLVMAAMAVLELVGARARGKREQLVAQANSHDWPAGMHRELQVLHGGAARARIAGPVGDEHGVEVLVQKIVVPRYADHGELARKELLEDARLAAAVNE